MSERAGAKHGKWYGRPALFGLTLTSAYLLAATTSSQEAEPDWNDMMAEAAWDWQAGDLIFRSGIDPIDDLIATATGAKFGSVGILRTSSGGPRVIYVDPENGVTETMLGDFIEGIGEQDYAVYRMASVNTLEQGGNLMPHFGLYRAYGFPADPHLILGPDAFYSAELVYLAAFGAGVQLGSPVRLADLASDSPELRGALLQGWEGHPYCQYFIDADDCWGVIENISIVTTDVIMNDENLTKQYP